MKKILFCLLVLVGLSFPAKPLIFEICNSRFCYDQIIPDAKHWEYIEDATGKQYIRVYFPEKWKLLDIFVDGKTVKQKK